MSAAPQRSLIIACGALAREVQAALDLARLDHVDLTCLPALLHNRPEKIPAAVRAAINAARPNYDKIFIAYADCGTGGLLDAVLSEAGVERLPGAHCYAFYSGVEAFTARGDDDMRAFFLTDFLARQFETLVIEGLGLDRYPELRDQYFGHYEKVVYLAQTHDADLQRKAELAALRLGLAYEHRFVGLGDLVAAVEQFGKAATVSS